MQRLFALILAAALPASVVAIAPAPDAQAAGAAGAVVKMRLRAMVKNLPVANERRAGYDRDKFRHWIDADRDCRDTRDEVLANESRTRVRGCDIRVGRWVSAYDGRRVRFSTNLDIDHLVPLAESWDSGAKRWNADTRKRFANDLGDRRSLIAVTASTNRSKSDRDPAEWMPRRGKCAYVQQWVAVKTRWSLKVDRREKQTLIRRANHCKNTEIRVRKAPVRTGMRAGGGGGGGGLDPRFGTCEEANDHGYGNYVRGRDREYSWYTDGDSDGVVCET